MLDDHIRCIVGHVHQTLFFPTSFKYHFLRVRLLLTEHDFLNLCKCLSSLLVAWFAFTEGLICRLAAPKSLMELKQCMCSIKHQMHSSALQVKIDDLILQMNTVSLADQDFLTCLPPEVALCSGCLARTDAHISTHTHTYTNTQPAPHMAISLVFEGLLWSYGTLIDWCSDELASPEPCDYLSLYFKRSAREEGLHTHHSLTLPESAEHSYIHKTHTQTLTQTGIMRWAFALNPNT